MTTTLKTLTLLTLLLTLTHSLGSGDFFSSSSSTSSTSSAPSASSYGTPYGDPYYNSPAPFQYVVPFSCGNNPPCSENPTFAPEYGSEFWTTVHLWSDYYAQLNVKILIVEPDDDFRLSSKTIAKRSAEVFECGNLVIGKVVNNGPIKPFVHGVVVIESYYPLVVWKTINSTSRDGVVQDLDIERVESTPDPEYPTSGNSLGGHFNLNPFPTRTPGVGYRSTGYGGY